MTPQTRWPELWHFFDVLHQDWDSEFADKDDCLSTWTAQATQQDLLAALTQWHQAFDNASDAELASTVAAFNPWWDADRWFSGAREWAYWVRAHLERELAGRRGREDAK